MAKQLHMLTKEQEELVRERLEKRVHDNQTMRYFMLDPWKKMMILSGINDVLAEKTIIGHKDRPTPWWMTKHDQRYYMMGVDRALDMLVPYRSVFPNVRSAYGF